MFKPIRFAVLLAGVTLAFAATAQRASNSSNQADPPSRVARLSSVHGAVSFVPAGENDWVEAQLNRPLITGDKLWTDNNARATLEIGTSAIRLDQQTSFDFLNLDDNTAQMELTQGTLNLRVRRLYDGQVYEVDTPTLAFVANRVGEFRISVLPNGQSTVVTVTHGGGDVYGEGNARFRVDEGQSVTFNDPQLQNYQTNQLPAADAFDNFNSERDQRWDNSASRRYVSEDVIGYQDLDDNGQWAADVPEYGNVWYPNNVAVGWSPYHNGNWGWVGAYGWTWVDDEPWGFAPSHYGRWAYVDNRWGWCPGPIGVRPYYAPALVAFIGGGGIGVDISIGGPIGWFPLGFRDPYFPSYNVSRDYFTNINVSNTTINNTTINNYYGNYSAGNVNYGQINYANRNIAGAVTAVPAATFVGARPVSAASIAVNRTTFANARVSGFAAVAPTRASLASPTAARAVPTAAVINRPIVAATKPPAPVAPFAQRQAVLAKNPGRPMNEHQMRGPAVVAGAAVGRGAAVAVARPNVNVVTQHGAPVRTAAPALPARAAGAAANTPQATQANSRANPMARPGAANVARPATAPNRPTDAAARPGMPNRPAAAPATAEQPRHLDSARFAHPGANAATSRGTQPGETQPARPMTSPSSRGTPNDNARSPMPSTQRPAPSTQRPTPRSEERTNGNPGQNPRNTAPTNRPENRQAPPQRQESRQTPQPRQESRPQQESRPSAQPRQDSRPQPQQEYRQPAQQPRPEYRQAPQAPRQESRPQAQPQQEYRQPPAQRNPQESQRPAPPQAAPRNAAPPVAHPRTPEQKKEDDKKNGGG